MKLFIELPGSGRGYSHRTVSGQPKSIMGSGFHPSRRSLLGYINTNHEFQISLGNGKTCANILPQAVNLSKVVPSYIHCSNTLWHVFQSTTTTHAMFEKVRSGFQVSSFPPGIAPFPFNSITTSTIMSWKNASWLTELMDMPFWPYGGIRKHDFDPFRPSSLWNGCPYYLKGGPSIRMTRWMAFDVIDSDSTFSISSTPTPWPMHPTPSNPHSFEVVGIFDGFASNLKLIPLPDPNVRAVGTRFNTDSAGNCYLKQKLNLGPGSYLFYTEGPLNQNAFVQSQQDYITNFTDPVSPTGSHGFLYGYSGLQLVLQKKSSGELISALMDHFQTQYDGKGQCCNPSHILNLQKMRGQNAKVDFMERNAVGSCRHRAFLGFLIMQEAGIPVRYIISKTHAWIECELSGNGKPKRWVYVDLGGCPHSYPCPNDAGGEEMSAYKGASTLEDKVEVPSSISDHYKKNLESKVFKN